MGTLSPAERTRVLRAFHDTLEDVPLPPDHRFYVPYREEAPSDPIAHLATQIDWRQGEGIYLLSGQRGSGKSTELLRLKARLEERGCVVFISDMRDYMNMTSRVEITDFFISLLGALAEAVRDRYGKDPVVEGYWTRLTNFLKTRVKIEELGFEKAGVSITASLREDPTFRQRVQEGLRGHVAAMVKEAHEFSGQIVEFVRKREKDDNKKVVYLVDSVEQVRGVGAEADDVYKSVENLFSGHAHSLKLPLLHVLYTLPPWLTPLAPGLGAQLGCGIQTLPSVHVYRARSREADPAGLEIMRRIVEKRFPDWRLVFSEDQLDGMTLATGGDLREFFYLVRYALFEIGAGGGELPVADVVITSGMNNMRRGMLPIAEEDRKWLLKIAESKDPQLQEVSKLPSLARFFDSKLVLNYRNGDDWFDIHPLLRPVVEGDASA
jgi:hypothetical protein